MKELLKSAVRIFNNLLSGCMRLLIASFTGASRIFQTFKKEKLCVYWGFMKTIWLHLQATEKPFGLTESRLKLEIITLGSFCQTLWRTEFDTCLLGMEWTNQKWKGCFNCKPVIFLFIFKLYKIKLPLYFRCSICQNLSLYHSLIFLNKWANGYWTQ